MSLFSREPPTDLDTNPAISPIGLLRALKVGLLILTSIIGLLFLTSQMSSRFNLDIDATYWIVVGAIFMTLTLIRPWWFWEHPTALSVRSKLTDPGTVILYLLITGSLIFTGVRRQLAIADARDACLRSLAAARTPQERVKALYGNGVASLPQNEDEPKAYTCERLLESK